MGNSPRYVLALDDRVLEVLVEDGSQGFSLHIAGRSYEIETARNRTRRPAQESEQFVDGAWVMRSPLTGVVTELRTGLGEAVTAGQILFVIEAMKMLNELRAKVDGVVTTLGAAQGDRVELGDLLITVEPTEPDTPAP